MTAMSREMRASRPAADFLPVEKNIADKGAADAQEKGGQHILWGMHSPDTSGKSLPAQ